MKTEATKAIATNYQPFIDFLEVLIWPIVAIVVVLILKRTIINLINRITKIGYGKLGAEATQQQQQIENPDKTLLEQSAHESKNEIVEKALGLFSQQTIERAKSVVNNESNVNEISDIKDKVDVLHKYSQALYLILSFERIYNVIFGSQLYILVLVNTKNTDTKASLKRYYDDAVKDYPKFYETYSYDDYFAFIENGELITLNENGNYEITFLGRDLLKYLVETGKSINKRY